MNIKKYMKKHASFINKQLLTTGDKQYWIDLKETHARMIQYMQHERLIHLLVILAFAVFLLITVAIVLITPYLQAILLTGLFFVLLVPYVIHYFFLENTIQSWYKLMDEIEKRIKS